MEIPALIEFHSNCNTILCKNLKAAEPSEGCCLLLGERTQFDQSKTNHLWIIKYIWPCENIWGKEQVWFQEPKNSKDHKSSKKNRFIIDPKSQIAAQRWARENYLEVLGTAHSHPNGDNKPSEIDLAWNAKPGLMIISDKAGCLQAWWINNQNNFQNVPLA